MERISLTTKRDHGDLGDYRNKYDHTVEISQTEPFLASGKLIYNGEQKAYPVGPTSFKCSCYTDNSYYGFFKKQTDAENRVYLNGQEMMFAALSYDIGASQTSRLHANNTVIMNRETTEWYKRETKNNWTDLWFDDGYPDIGIIAPREKKNGQRGSFRTLLGDGSGVYDVAQNNSATGRYSFEYSGYSRAISDSHDWSKTSHISLLKPETPLFKNKSGYSWVIHTPDGYLDSNYEANYSTVSVFYGDKSAYSDPSFLLNAFQFYDPVEISGIGTNIQLKPYGEAGFFKNDYIDAKVISTPNVQYDSANKRIFWNKCTGALRYDVYVNGTLVYTIKNDTDPIQYLSISTIQKYLARGNNDIQVRAFRYKLGGEYIDYLNGIDGTKAPTKKYFNVVMKGKDRTFTAISTTLFYDIYLPSKISNSIRYINLDKPNPRYAVNSTGTTMTVLWDKDSGVDKYEVVFTESTGKQLKLETQNDYVIYDLVSESLKGYLRVNCYIDDKLVISSDNIPYDITRIANPTVSLALRDFKTVRVSWEKPISEFADITEYIVKYNNKETVLSSETLYIDYSELHSGSHIFYVKAITGNSKLNSDFVSADITVPKLDIPTNLSVSQTSFNSMLFKWNSVANTNKYYFRIDNGIWKSTTGLQTEFKELENKTYKFDVYASYNDINDSDTASINGTVPKLNPLSLSLDRKAIDQIYAEWSAPNIDSNSGSITYYVSFDNGVYEALPLRQRVYNGISIGDHTVSVYVKVEYNGKSITSEVTTKTITISPLSNPVISYSKTGKGIEWSNYSDAKFAQGYKIYRSKNTEDNYTEITTTTNRFYIFDEGLEQAKYFYKIKAFFILTSPVYPKDYFDSGYSNSLDIIVSNLGDINIAWKVIDGETTSILVITPSDETHISKFIIHVDNETVETQSKEFSGIRELTNDIEGKHTVWVEAVSNSPLYLNTTSDRGKDLVFSIDTIPTPVISYNTSSRTITWNDVKGVYQTTETTQYDLYVNETKVEYTKSGNELYYVLPDSIDTATVYIERAYTNNITQYPNPLHFDSAKSNTLSIGTWPDAINLRVEDGKLKWDLSDYRFEPFEYDIYNYGELYDTVDVREYTIPNSEENIFNFSIKIPASGNMNESSTAVLESITVSVRKLQTPSINVDKIPYMEDGQEYYKYYLTIAGSTESVEYYKLFINSIETAYLNPGQSYYEISLPVGSTEIRVQACSTDYLTINSELSNIVIKYVPVDYHYYALINNSLQREVVMPLSIVLNADESLSSGTVTLALNDDSVPYEPKTEIHIGITGTELGNQSDSYVDLNGWDFLIATDEMEEVYVNNQTKYRHYLTLIDRTKLLEYDILPNISFTQPQSVTEVYETVKNYTPSKYKVLSLKNPIMNVYSMRNRLVEFIGKEALALLLKNMAKPGAILSGYILELYNLYKAIKDKNLGVEFDVKTITSNLGAFYGEIPKILYSDQNIVLPYQFEPRYEVIRWRRNYTLTEQFKKFFSDPLNCTWNAYLKDETNRNFKDAVIDSRNKYYMTLRYYIRKHSDSFEKDSTATEYPIATYNFLENGYNYPTFNFEELRVPDPDFKTYGNYDIICEIDDLQEDVVGYINEDSLYTNFGYDVDYTQTRHPSAMAEHFNDGNIFDRDNASYDKSTMRKYRTIWSNIELTQELNPNSKKEGFISIVDAIERCINSIEPLQYNAELPDKHESAKYMLSPKFKSNTVYQNMECPQISFTGRSLFEALLQLGREFLGVPKLTKTADSLNTIDFLIMDPSDIAKDDTHEYVIESKSDIENNVSGFVSDVSNMVSSDHNAIWYPSENGWITPRSTDPGDATITVENCGLSVDKDIYRIKQVLVSGYNASNEYIDITKYIYEQTIYNSLNNNRNGKGLALYYSRGDNRIYGLGILPEVTKFKAALGLSETTYVINRILAKELGDPKLERKTDIVKDLKFRIRYVPYTDTQIKLTQFNISSENNFSYKAYNQGDKLISDERYGSSMAKQVDRLGNKDIVKTYLTKSISRIQGEDGKELIDTGLPALFECRTFNNSRYYLDHVSYSFNEQFISIDARYTKNYNKINERIGVNSEYREYEISLTPAVQRPVIFNQYCYIDSREIIPDSKYGITKKNMNPIWNTIIENMLEGNPDKAPSQFYLSFKDSAKKPLQYHNAGGSLESLKNGILIPVSKLNIRNAVLLNAKMYDNFSAGSYVDKSVAIDKNIGFYAQKDARYVDELGRAYLADISLCSPDASMLQSYDLPICPYKGATFDSINGTVFSGTYVIDKDSQEALNFTYQMNFNTLDSNLDIQSGLTRFLFSDAIMKKFKKPHIYLYRGNLKTIDMLSLVDYQDLGEIEIGYTDLDTRYINSKSTTLSEDWDGYCIAYPFSYSGKNKEILLYAEKKGKSGESYITDKLYFNFLSKPILMNNIKNSELNDNALWGITE